MQQKADSITELYTGLQSDIFNRIIYYLNESKYKNVDKDNVLMWQAEQLSKMGLLTNDVIKMLSDVTGVAENRIKELVVGNGTQVGIEMSVQLAQLTSKPKIHSDNQELLNRLLEQSYSDMNNVVNQSLISRNTENNSALRTYQDIVNKSTVEVTSGLKTHEKAIADNVYKWVEAGLQSTLVDKAGHHWNLEAYSRMVMNTTAHNTYNSVRLSTMGDYEITQAMMSSHVSARPACANIQGHIVNVVRAGSKGYNPKYDSIFNHGYGEAGGTQGINCHHELFPYREGVSTNPFKPIDPDKALKNGEIVAKQRALERRIRKDKQLLDKAQNLHDKQGEAYYKSRLGNHRKQVRQLIDEHDFLHRDYSREKVMTPPRSKLAVRKPLTFEELRGIVNYVGPDYAKINQGLREGTTLTTVQRQTMHELDSALTKLPKYQDKEPLYRSLTFHDPDTVNNFLRTKPVGSIFNDKAYTSAGDKGFNEKENTRMVIVKSQNGRMLQDLNTNGREVLFKRNTQFKVINKYFDKNKLPIMEVEEYVPRKKRRRTR
nr:phage minor capsid protein [Companilactobacillus mishanensis]